MISFRALFLILLVLRAVSKLSHLHLLTTEEVNSPTYCNPCQAWITDSTLWTRSGTQVLDSRLHVSEFRIQKGFFSGIPDSKE